MRVAGDWTSGHALRDLGHPQLPGSLSPQVPGRRGIRGRRVVPGTEQSTVPLTRRSRMAKWQLCKGDMMVFGRPIGGAGR